MGKDPHLFHRFFSSKSFSTANGCEISFRCSWSPLVIECQYKVKIFYCQHIWLSTLQLRSDRRQRTRCLLQETLVSWRFIIMWWYFGSLLQTSFTQSTQLAYFSPFSGGGNWPFSDMCDAQSGCSVTGQKRCRSDSSDKSFHQILFFLPPSGAPAVCTGVLSSVCYVVNIKCSLNAKLLYLHICREHSACVW